MNFCNMVRRNRRNADSEISPVWIAPGMKLHTALMSFFDHELKRIIIRQRRLSLDTRKPLAPGFKWRRIKSISSRPHLYDHCIHAIHLMQIKLADKFSTLTVGVHHSFWRPVNIVDRCDPNTAEFGSNLCEKS